MNASIYACIISFSVSFAAMAAPPSVLSAPTEGLSDEAKWNAKRDLHACSHWLGQHRVMCLARVHGQRAVPVADGDAALTTTANNHEQARLSRVTLERASFDHRYQRAVDNCDSPGDSARDECAEVAVKRLPRP